MTIPGVTVKDRPKPGDKRAPMLRPGVTYLDHAGERWLCIRVSECSALVRPLSERAAKQVEVVTRTGEVASFTRPGKPTEINPRPIGWREEK